MKQCRVLKPRFEKRGFTRRQYKIKYWMPAIAWAILIFSLSSMSKIPSAPLKFQGLDKLAHLIEYFVLGMLVNYGFINSDIKNNARHMTIICCLTYALADELHQAFVPLREASFFDWIADASGIILSQAYNVMKIK